MNTVTGELARLERWKTHMMGFEGYVMDSFNEQARQNAVLQSGIDRNGQRITSLANRLKNCTACQP